MMYEQVQKRLADFAAKHRKLPALEAYGREGRVVAIKVPDALYARLKAQADKHGGASMKETIYHAVQAGLAVMESE
jgi:hypothetical protein